MLAKWLWDNSQVAVIDQLTAGSFFFLFLILQITTRITKCDNMNSSWQNTQKVLSPCAINISHPSLGLVTSPQTAYFIGIILIPQASKNLDKINNMWFTVLVYTFYETHYHLKQFGYYIEYRRRFSVTLIQTYECHDEGMCEVRSQCPKVSVFLKSSCMCGLDLKNLYAKNSR